MTLSTNPTFICKDRSGAPFALTLKLPRHMQKDDMRGGGLDFKLYKKGWTVVVRRPVRSGVKDGKQGFVECEVEESLVCFESRDLKEIALGLEVLIDVIGYSSEFGKVSRDAQ